MPYIYEKFSGRVCFRQSHPEVQMQKSRLSLCSSFHSYNLPPWFRDCVPFGWLYSPADILHGVAGSKPLSLWHELAVPVEECSQIAKTFIKCPGIKSHWAKYLSVNQSLRPELWNIPISQAWSHAHAWSWGWSGVSLPEMYG